MLAHILDLLRQDRGYVSGERMCTTLGVSRTAVWKHVRQLRELGYDIDARRNRGYCLRHSPDTPHPLELGRHLETATFGRSCHYFTRVDSTNRVAGRLAADGEPEGTIVTADCQTGGRGRQQRSWHSPAGSNLYVSVILRPDAPPHRAPQLAVVTAVGVVRALNHLFPRIPFAIKWPNDILVGQRKIAGILCDLDAEIDHLRHVVLGIGLNANVDRFPAEIASSATSLRREFGHDVSRPLLLARILASLETAYHQWSRAGLTAFQDEWGRWSYLDGQRVVLINGSRRVRGTVRGLSASGGLTVHTEAGGIETFHSGDTHLDSW